MKLRGLSSLVLVSFFASGVVEGAPRAAAGADALEPLPSGGEVYDYTPDFSADGRTILFSSTRAGGEAQLFTVDVATGAVEQLTEGPERNHCGSYSPDGSRIAFVSTRSGDEALWVMHRDGSQPRRLTEGGQGLNERPDWSPDGRFLAFDWEQDGRRKIWTVEVASGAMRQITDGPAEDTYPSWSPDGKSLVFMSRGRRSTIDLWIVDLDGSGLRRLTEMPNTAWAPRWSDDGTRIAFWSGEGWDYQVFTIAPDGTDLRQLTNAWEYNWSPRWSRDGEWRTFRSSRAGRGGEIYVVRSDGSDLRRVTYLGPSAFARAVHEVGVDAALSQLAYSRQRDPEAVFTSNLECRALIRELLERGELAPARRLADWNLLENPSSSGAGDIWIEVLRAHGEATPPTASELVALLRRGAYDEVRSRYAAGRLAFPSWRPFSSHWFRWLLQELGWLAAHDEEVWLAEEALSFYPERAEFHTALAGLARTDRAVAAARRALELDPDQQAALHVLEEVR